MKTIYTLNDPPPTIKDLEVYTLFQSEFDNYIGFFENYSDLYYEVGHVKILISNKGAFNLDWMLIDSASNTLKCIKDCCANGAFSDANTLVRKLRDDLLLFVYLLEVIESKKILSESLDNDDEILVHAWFSNTVQNLPKPLKGKLKSDTYMT